VITVRQGGFPEVIAALRGLAEVPSRTTKAVAPLLLARWRADWRAGKDPHGRAWAALAPNTLAKGRTPPPMIETGGTLASTAVRPLKGSGLAITVGGFASLHMRSTTVRPARATVPTMGVPASWRGIIAKAAKEQAARAAGGKR
jgi:hypothetical protein